MFFWVGHFSKEPLKMVGVSELNLGSVWRAHFFYSYTHVVPNGTDLLGLAPLGSSVRSAIFIAEMA